MNEEVLAHWGAVAPKKTDKLNHVKGFRSISGVYLGRDSNRISSVKEATFCHYNQRPNFDVHLYKVTVKNAQKVHLTAILCPCPAASLHLNVIYICVCKG